ncbi:MAG: InlB B-repeat-containing protein [Rikenellaceae bacterium]|nr:InlB B-repeat-containing protein [Rikenellaceae bacterium]
MKRFLFYLSVALTMGLLASGCNDSEDDVLTYTVTFDSQGGSKVTSQTVSQGGKVSKPTDPTKEGYTFAGWFRESTFANEWDFDSDVVTSDLTLYAYWLDNSVMYYTVSFHTGSGSEVEDKQVAEGTTIPRPDDPELAGYELGGWYTEPEYEYAWDFDNDVVLSDMTLYANWLPGDAANSYFIAVDGDDDNPGTIDAPFASLNHALSVVQPGQTIYIREGTYYMTNDDITHEDNTWVYVFDISTAGGKVSGTEDAPINIWGYEGERPVIDMSQVRPEPVKRVIAFYVDRSYYHFKNFEIVGTQVVVTGHTQSECFRNDGGNYNIYENLAMHDGMAIGFYLTRGMYNLILNCDAYNNYDNFSEGAYGGNVDGFGAHVPNANHVGNVFRGCRAWWNSDDGFDLINCFAPVIFENCWSFYNGYQPGTMDNAGDGSGFKAGGYGLSGIVTIDVVPMHIVRGCLAYYNLNQGFYSNHHLGGIGWYNNTAMANPSNFNMLNRDAPENVYDRPEGYGHIIKNNVSYEPRRTGQHLINIDFDECEVGINSFYPVEMELTDADFVSLDPDELMAPRKADGSLPDIDFLRPAPGSQLIGVGEDLGYDFTGTTLGCFQ